MANISVLNYCVDSWHYQQEGNRILKFISAVQRGIPLRSFATLKCKRAKMEKKSPKLIAVGAPIKKEIRVIVDVSSLPCSSLCAFISAVYAKNEKYHSLHGRFLSSIDSRHGRKETTLCWTLTISRFVGFHPLRNLKVDAGCWWCRCRNYAIFIIWKSNKRWTIKFFLAAKNPPRRHSSAQWELWSQHTGPMLETFFSLPNDIERKIFQEALGI